MDDDALWLCIDTERAYVADLLDSLPETAWATASLCEGWTVRDVGAHLAFAHARFRDILGPAIRSGFRYNAMVKRAALDSPLSPGEIVATIRSFIGSRRHAPLVTDVEPLLDVLVHTQDICVPLGIEHPMQPDAAAVAAARIFTLKGPMRLWRPARGVRLVATDVDWSHGDGRVIEAPIQDLLLALTGRPTHSGVTQGLLP